jgi:amidase
MTPSADSTSLAQPERLSAAEAVTAIAEGRLTSEALVRACLERIREREPVVHAFAFLDPERALAEARERDRVPREARGPLHGLPIGVKDIIDTCDMPTTCGSPIYREHRPPNDAACVALAREAGAVMLGKTVTTEFALKHPGATANPHDPARTPGGSSSGSAAAVADFMVPCAFGTQTGGSIIRPASFCGVVGYKPSHGTVNPTGVKALATSFDTVGLLARTVDDCALVVGVLSGAAGPPGMAAKGGGEEAARARAWLALEAVRPMRIGLCRTHVWPHAEPATVHAVVAAASAMREAGIRVDDVELPRDFEPFVDIQNDVLRYEAARVFAYERTRHPDKISAELREEMSAGLAVIYERYRECLATIARCRALFADAIAEFDAFLSPSAPGEAPRGLAFTGDAMFNRLTSGLGVPCITLPAFLGPNGLPVGVQLIGGIDEDLRLLQVAKWAAAEIRPNRGRSPHP